MAMLAPGDRCELIQRILAAGERGEWHRVLDLAPAQLVQAGSGTASWTRLVRTAQAALRAVLQPHVGDTPRCKDALEQVNAAAAAMTDDGKRRRYDRKRTAQDAPPYAPCRPRVRRDTDPWQVEPGSLRLALARDEQKPASYARKKEARKAAKTAAPARKKPDVQPCRPRATEPAHGWVECELCGKWRRFHSKDQKKFDGCVHFECSLMWSESGKPRQLRPVLCTVPEEPADTLERHFMFLRGYVAASRFPWFARIRDAAKGEAAKGTAARRGAVPRRGQLTAVERATAEHCLAARRPVGSDECRRAECQRPLDGSDNCSACGESQVCREPACLARLCGPFCSACGAQQAAPLLASSTMRCRPSGSR
jgi:hypothetical protein